MHSAYWQCVAYVTQGRKDLNRPERFLGVLKEKRLEAWGAGGAVLF